MIFSVALLLLFKYRGSRSHTYTQHVVKNGAPCLVLLASRFFHWHRLGDVTPSAATTVIPPPSLPCDLYTAWCSMTEMQ